MKSKLSSLSIFTPAFNEEENIKDTIEDALAHAKKLADEYEIIVVNDGSRDKTAEVVKKISKKNKHVRLVSHKVNRGYGAAVKTGLKSCKMDWIFFTDSDGQFKMNELKKFVDNRSKGDLIIGYRKKRMDPFHRIFIAQVLLKLWNRVLFGLKVKDVDCAYKLFPRNILKDIKLKTESAITVTEFLVKAKNTGYSFHQMPVTHYERKHGVQTGGNLGVILKAAKDSFFLVKSTASKKRIITRLWIIALLAIALFLRVYRIENTLNFHHDEGRDLLIVKRMIDERRPILIGPQTSMGNMYLGPLYYYLITIPLLLSNYNPVGPAIFIALTGVATVGIIFHLTKKWFGLKAALIASLFYAVMPLPVLFTRNSWNPNLAPLITLIAYNYLDKLITNRQGSRKRLNFFLLGFFIGVLLQLHYVALLFATLSAVILLYNYRTRIAELLKGFFMMVAGGATALSPFILFELRHKFVNTQAAITFIKSPEQGEFRFLAPLWLYWQHIYKTSLDLIGGLFGKEFIFAEDPYTSLITASFGILILGSIFFFRRINKTRVFALYILVVVSIIASASYQSPIFTHYLGFLFPITYILVAAIATHTRKAYRLIAILALSISFIYTAPALPKYLRIAAVSNNQISRTTVAVDEILKRADGESYNFVAAHDTTRDAAYLYFLYQADNPPSNELQDKIFLICEDRECQPDDANNPWIFRKGPSHPSLDKYLGHPFMETFTAEREIIDNIHITHGVFMMELKIQNPDIIE